MKSDKHIFALYMPELPKGIGQQRLVDKELAQRVSSVLRLRVDDPFILFNREENLEAIFKECSKKEVVLDLGKKNKNKLLQPKIRFLLPLLKRDALEAAVYSCVELGASEIQLIVTQKSLQTLPEKAMARLEKIAIAAAEQSKNFSFPLIKAPITLTSSLEETVIFFDAQGGALKEVLKKESASLKNGLSLLIGPEGDLAQSEKIFLEDKGVVFCRLTPTILRARAAVALGLGIFRTGLG